MKKDIAASKPKVSVILAIYNMQGYLPKCLKSLINQTLQDIEIICVNDGSTDDCSAILECFARKDKRIKIFNQENCGPGVARNNGISKATGEYIGFVDPDDTIKADMYEKMYNQAQKLNSDIVICDYVRYQTWSGHIIAHNAFEKAVKYIKAVPLNIPEGENIDRETLLDTLLVSPCYSVNRIYRRSLLQKNNIRFSDNMCYEDCPLVLQSHLSAKNVSFLNYAGYNYFLRKQSIVRAYTKKYLDFFEITEKLKHILAEHGLSDRMALNLHYFKTMNMAWIYDGLLDSEKKSFMKSTCKFIIAQELYEIKRK